MANTMDGLSGGNFHPGLGYGLVAPALTNRSMTGLVRKGFMGGGTATILGMNNAYNGGVSGDPRKNVSNVAVSRSDIVVVPKEKTLYRPLQHVRKFIPTFKRT